MVTRKLNTDVKITRFLMRHDKSRFSQKFLKKFHEEIKFSRYRNHSMHNGRRVNRKIIKKVGKKLNRCNFLMSR